MEKKTNNPFTVWFLALLGLVVGLAIIFVLTYKTKEEKCFDKCVDIHTESSEWYCLRVCSGVQ